MGILSLNQMSQSSKKSAKKSRRSSFGGSLKSNLDVNDDEAEREERRLQKEEKAREAAVMGTPYRSPSGRKSMHSTAVDEEVVAKISQIISLAQENKINAGNSFKTMLLENLDTAVGIRDKETNFQQASCALDAGAKIYASRVDNVHSNALKVLGGLGRTEQIDEGDDMDEDVDPTDTPKAKTRTKKVSSANVIEANLDNINLKKDANSFTVDPMFHIMSAKFDEGGARGLLMHNLHVSWEGGITFDSAAAAGTDGQPAEPGESHCAASLIDALREVEMPNDKMCLCPEFEQYQLTIKGEEADASSNMENDSPPSSSEINEMLPYESDEEDCGMADDWNEGGEQEEFSMMEQHEGGSASPTLVGLTDRSAPEVLASQVAMLEAIQDGYADYSSEYSFFGKMQACWVGAAAQRLHTFKSAMAPQPKKRAEKIPFSINFDGIDEMDFGKSYDIPLKVGMDQQTDASITKQYNSKQDLLLPATDHQFGLRNFTSLFLRPTTALRDSGKVTAGGASEVCVDQWNYDNPADATNYTANDAEGCAMDDMDDDDGMGFNEMGGGEYGFDSGDLIAEPSRVAKIQVNFDRVARQIDVKMLKECMWKQISDEPKEEEEHHTFSQVMADVPKVIPAEMLPNVSVPYCFICLLHLANENNLEIIDQRDNEVNDLSELTIKLDGLKAA